MGEISDVVRWRDVERCEISKVLIRKLIERVKKVYEETRNVVSKKESEEFWTGVKSARSARHYSQYLLRKWKRN